MAAMKMEETNKVNSVAGMFAVGMWIQEGKLNQLDVIAICSSHS